MKLIATFLMLAAAITTFADTSNVTFIYTTNSTGQNITDPNPVNLSDAKQEDKKPPAHPFINFSGFNLAKAPPSLLEALNNTKVWTFILPDDNETRSARMAYPGDVLNTGDVQNQTIYNLDRPYFGDVSDTSGGQNNDKTSMNSVTFKDDVGENETGAEKGEGENPDRNLDLDPPAKTGNGTAGDDDGSKNQSGKDNTSEDGKNINTGGKDAGPKINTTGMDASVVNSGDMDKQVIVNIDNQFSPHFNFHMNDNKGVNTIQRMECKNVEQAVGPDKTMVKSLSCQIVQDNPNSCCVNRTCVCNTSQEVSTRMIHPYDTIIPDSEEINNPRRPGFKPMPYPKPIEMPVGRSRFEHSADEMYPDTKDVFRDKVQASGKRKPYDTYQSADESQNKSPSPNNKNRPKPNPYTIPSQTFGQESEQNGVFLHTFGQEGSQIYGQHSKRPSSRKPNQYKRPSQTFEQEYENEFSQESSHSYKDNSKQPPSQKPKKIKPIPIPQMATEPPSMFTTIEPVWWTTVPPDTWTQRSQPKRQKKNKRMNKAKESAKATSNLLGECYKKCYMYVKEVEFSSI